MIKIVEGNITEIKAEAIVNAANEHLFHGGGVAGAIVRAGGGEIIEESRKIIKEKGKLKVGEAVFTSPGNLKEKGVKHIIHAVGPRGTRPELLEKAVNNVFKLARKLKLKSLALPAISCGIFGFDKEKGSKIIFEIAKKYEKEFEIFLVSLDKEVVKFWKDLRKG